ncbi:LacI family DNA-binding transcriptional regulator [Streptacidiphilus sp. N1-12]|uniref:LacI family DNA-binding transcriptional regulator n=2 Tax=Streptacidiphilus alkalitolerans TaxID=3342712 RepID=A0ABV6WVH8_9ACTN
MKRKPPSLGSVTLEDVARVAGVSRATVSRVINGSTTVDPAMRLLVENAVAATNYVPNRAARSLVTRRTDSIALVVSEAESRHVADPFLGRMFTDPFFGRVVTGVMEVIRPRGVQMVLMLVDDADSRAHLVSYLRQGHVDGVVLICGHVADPLPGLLAEAGVPAVLSGRPGQTTPISFVEADQRAGAVLAVDHLVSTGRRRIAHLAGPQDMPSAQERLTGFRQAVAAHGLQEAGVGEGDFTQAGGAAAMRELLAKAPDLDAVFVASDLMALGAIPVLNRAGRRVPEDIALVGFDDSSAALACDPPLTTVRQPLEEMAARMAQLLLAQIVEPSEALQSAVFHPTLVLRGSA